MILKNILIILGCFLILVSLTIFLGFSALVYQIVYQPEQITILNFLAQHIPETDQAIFGVVNENHFSIHVVEQVKLIFCLVAIAICLLFFVGFFRAIMSLGVELLKTSVSLQEQQDMLDASLQEQQNINKKF